MAYVRVPQATEVPGKSLGTPWDIDRSRMVLEMEKLEERARYTLLDVVEEVVVEMSRLPRHDLGNQAQVTADNVQEELEKEPGMHRMYHDLMTKVLRIARGS